MSYATVKQREEIKRLGKLVFKGDIEREAFLVFSPWLQGEFGYFQLEDILFSAAPLVIEKLKEMKNITNHHTKPPEGYILNKPMNMDEVIGIATKYYLKGIYAGQQYPDKKAPTDEKIKKKIKEELEQR